jgi:hypothetical protein
VHPLRRAFALALVLLGGLGVGVALSSCGGEDEAETTRTQTTTTTTETTDTLRTTEPELPVIVRITVVNGAPRGGIVRKTVQKGDAVVIVVASDVADEVHLHGYDLKRDVAAGGTARIRFTAKVPGRFEVELEQRGVQIADLTVEP